MTKLKHKFWLFFLQCLFTEPTVLPDRVVVVAVVEEVVAD